MKDKTNKIEEIEESLKVIKEEISELIKKRDELSDKLERLEKERKDKIYFKEWKVMEGKYYHVWLFTVSEEDKFKRCQYVHVIKVEKNLLKYEYINYDEKCMFITISSHDFVYKRGYKEWTEISKKDYDKIVSSTKNLERLNFEK